MAFDTTPRTESYIAELLEPARKQRRRTKRSPNWKSRSTGATLYKQALIRELLSSGLPFTVRAIGDALGISRQLALYHVKKMAATARLVMVLEPCAVNGGLQFKVWDPAAIMAHYAVKAQLALRSRAA